MRAVADVLEALIDAIASVVIVALTFAFIASPLILIALLIWRATS